MLIEGKNKYFSTRKKNENPKLKLRAQIIKTIDKISPINAARALLMI